MYVYMYVYACVVEGVVVNREVSNWKSVLSGVPLESVLKRILFLSMDDDITDKVLRFDDTALLAKVNNYGDKQLLQNAMTRYIS